MVMGEEDVILLLPLFHVHICVVGARHQDGRSTLIEWVVRELEAANVTFNLTLDPDARLGNELFALPVPEEDLPVGAACERHNHALFLRAEGARHELLRIKRIHVLNLLGKGLNLVLIAGFQHIVDGELAFVTSGAALTNRQVLLAF